jgi:large subunit ribosomal protein L21
MAEVKAPIKKSPATKKPAAVAAPRAASKPSKAGFYAVIATGGKQYRVKEGDRLKIEKLSDTHKVGDLITFDKVLLVDDGSSEATIGSPFIAGASVNAKLEKISRYKTIDVIKYKQKSRYFKKYGHRQPYFEVKIVSIK